MTTAIEFFDLVGSEIENNSSNLSPEKLNLFRDYYEEAGLISTYKRAFFFNHYAVNLEKVAVEMSKRLVASDLIVDLGGGTGSQAIYLASKGYKVLVLDMDEVALETCEIRVKYYEKIFGKDLAITTRYANAIDLDWSSIDPFKAVYSLFAFNMIQPSENLIENICDCIEGEDPIICIQDGNNQHPILKRLRPRPAKSMDGLNDLFKKNRFLGCHNDALLAFPPAIHWILGEDRALRYENKFTGKFNLNISWLHIYLRR